MTLYRRGNVYWAYWYVDGVRQQRSTGSRNRRRAENIEQKLREDFNERRFQIPQAVPQIKFKELATKFLAGTGSKKFHQDRLKPLQDFFGDVPVRTITKGMVREYRTKRKQEKPDLTESTLNRDAAVLRHVLYWGLEEGLIPVNPLARLHLEPERRVKRSVLSVKEERVLLRQAPEHLRRIILAALYTGMRRGEILHQRWEDVDFDRRVLYVSRSKTPGGEAREIPLAANILPMLRRMKKPKGSVFTYKGEPLADYKTSWNRVVKKVLSRHFRFHELRHTFATRLMEAGVMQEVRKALMGHSSGKDIQAVYTHVELPAKRAAIRKLERWVKKQTRRR